MSYTRFNRHENMTAETLREIGNILMEEGRWEASFDVVNMIYGLYDGYLYEDLLPMAKKELSEGIFNRLKNVVNIVKNYPKIFG